MTIFLQDRSVIDVEIRRAHLISQWPLLFTEWLERGPPARRLAAACAAAGLCAALLFAPLLLVRNVAMPAPLGWAVLAGGFAVAISFMYSVHGRPVGVFALALMLERRSKPRAAGGRAPKPARRRHIESRRLPAPDTATEA